MDLLVIDLKSQRLQRKGFRSFGDRVRMSSEQSPVGIREEGIRDDRAYRGLMIAVLLVLQMIVVRLRVPRARRVLRTKCTDGEEVLSKDIKSSEVPT